MSGIELFITAVVAAWLIGFGGAAARFAVRRRREPATWALFGAILGPAALAILSTAPPGRCWRCHAPTEGWLTLCAWCGEDVREPLPDIPEDVVRAPAQLTVIEGTAPRPPRPGPVAMERDTTEPAAPPRPAAVQGPAPQASTIPNVPAAPDRRSVETVPRERRIDLSSPPPLAEQARRMPAATAPAASTTIEAAADPVRRLKASLGRSTQSLGAAMAAAAAPIREPEPVAGPNSIILASAIYVTGSRGLQAGSRYGIALSGDDLRILGPVDINPSAVAIHHSLRGMDATGLQGRLIITATDGRRDQLALVFMSVAGGSPEGVADAIVTAADELERDSR